MFVGGVSQINESIIMHYRPKGPSASLGGMALCPLDPPLVTLGRYILL